VCFFFVVVVVEESEFKHVAFIVRDPVKWYDDELRFLSGVDAFPLETGSCIGTADPFLKYTVACHCPKKNTLRHLFRNL